MKVLFSIIGFVLALLSVLAGVAKAMQMPQEMEFLQAIGLSSTVIVSFGFVQILGGLLFIIPKTRLIGAIVLTIGFLISTFFILVSGITKFALISLIPVVLGSLVVLNLMRTTHNNKLQDDAASPRT